ncbi:MAG: PAS domain S-box protein [Candidatus Omnitrophota bacterium]
MSEIHKIHHFNFFSPDSSNQNNSKIPKEIAEQGHVQETYRMLEKAVEQSMDGIAVADMNGVIRFCNQAWADMHGYCISELIGKHLSIFHTKEQMRKDVAPFNEQVKKNGSHHGEVGHIRKNREVFETWMTINIVKDEKGNSIGLVGIARDITERKLAEAELRKSKERFQQVADNALGWIWEVDANGLYTYASPMTEEILGYKTEEVVGKKHFYDFFHPEDLNKLKNAAFESFASKQPFREFINRNRHKNGSTIWLSTSGVPIIDEKGDLLGYRGSDADITERKEAEEQLTQSEQKWRSLVQNVPDIIMTVKRDGKILAINRTVKGMTPEEVIGKSIYDYIAPEYQRIVKKTIENVFKTRKPDIYTILGAGSEGPNKAWYETRVIPIILDNEVAAVTQISTDITECKQAEKQQKSMTVGLRAVLEAAEEFIACPDAETVFLRAVEFARERFGLERCAIFMEQGGYVRGIYGTDRHGKTTDERANKFEKTEVWKKRLKMLDPRNPNWVVVREPLLEWDGKSSVQIGEGWLVITPIQSAHGQIGVFINDAAISKAELDPMKQDTLAVFCSLIGNIIERKRAESKLEILNRKLANTSKRFRQLALRDSQTGCYNHRYLEEAIESEFNRAKRYGYSLSLIMMDLDYFKSINDVYGHQFGDIVLKQFARQLKKIVRQYDILVRFGGEEFIVISPGIDKSTSLTLSRRILDSINLFNFGNQQHSVKLKLSIAVVSYPEDKIIKSTDLINVVDKILSKVKEDGGDRIYSFADTKKSKPSYLDSKGFSHDIGFLQEKIEKLTKRANQSLIESIYAFAKTIKLKDQYTGEHAENTVYYATEIARKLDLPKKKIEDIRQAAKLHDLGKIGISDRILLKKSRLSKSEFEEIKKHTQIGVDILRPLHFFHDIIPAILHHHERWDGKGYPHGLKQEEIPIGARIVAIADVFQALVSNRPYRPAFSRNNAIKLIKQGAGSQFDPKIVDTFLTLI